MTFFFFNLNNPFNYKMQESGLKNKISRFDGFLIALCFDF